MYLCGTPIFITMKTHRPRFDKAWHEAIALYPDAADREALTAAILDYQTDCTEPILPPALMVAFNFLRPTIDRRRRNAEKARLRREANACAPRLVEPAAETEAEPGKLEDKPSHGCAVTGSPTLLTDMYGERLENDRDRLLRIASEASRRCRKPVMVKDVVRNISFFNDYLFHSTEKVDSEEAYMRRFVDFFGKLMALPDIGKRLLSHAPL